MFVSHLSFFSLLSLRLRLGTTQESSCSRQELSGDTHYALVHRKKWIVLRQATAAGGNAPLTPHTRHCASFQRVRLMGDDSPSIMLGVLRGCMALKVLLCSGDDASP